MSYERRTVVIDGQTIEFVDDPMEGAPIEEIAKIYNELLADRLKPYTGESDRLGADGSVAPQAEFCRSVMGDLLSPIQEKMLAIADRLPKGRPLVLGTGRSTFPSRLAMMAVMGDLPGRVAVVAPTDDAAKAMAEKVAREVEIIRGIDREPAVTDPPPRNRHERRRAAALARRAG